MLHNMLSIYCLMALNSEQNHNSHTFIQTFQIIANWLSHHQTTFQFFLISNKLNDNIERKHKYKRAIEVRQVSYNICKQNE